MEQYAVEVVTVEGALTAFATSKRQAVVDERCF